MWDKFAFFRLVQFTSMTLFLRKSSLYMKKKKKNMLITAKVRIQIRLEWVTKKSHLFELVLIRLK